MHISPLSDYTVFILVYYNLFIHPILDIVHIALQLFRMIKKNHVDIFIILFNCFLRIGIHIPLLSSYQSLKLLFN